jgi:hypothetical protein
MQNLKTAKKPRHPEDEPSPEYSSLKTVVKIDNFRYHMTRWIVENHLPFTVIKDVNFRAMLRSLNDVVNKQVIRTGDTIRNWVQDEFVTA